MQLSPVIKQCIFQNHSLWKEEWESRSFIAHHEDAEFSSQLSVIPLLCLFHHVEIFVQL